jgi:hypothetical protein
MALAHALLFFVNGTFCVRGDMYAMRFLAQFGEAGTLVLRVTSLEGSWAYSRTLESPQEARAWPTVIEVPIDDVAMSATVVRRYAYAALFGGEEVRGTFALVGTLARNDLRFGFVACNDNCAESTWNTYRKRSTESAWPALGDEGVDVIVHCGDQVYADGVYAAARAGASPEECQARLRELYTTTYAEPSQARAMRSALNVAILDDHEVADGYGVVHIDAPYVALALAAYRAYQCDFRANVFCEATDDYSFVERIGKYSLVALDERSSMVRSGVAVDERAVELVSSVAREARREVRELIVVSPRPLVYLDPVSTLVCGALSSDGQDALMYPKNMPGTLRLRSALLEHIALGGRACVVSGDVHCSFVQTHRGTLGNADLEEMVTSGVSRAPLTSEPVHIRLVAAAALAAFALCAPLLGVARRSEVAWSANYGVLSSGDLRTHSAPFSAGRQTCAATCYEFPNHGAVGEYEGATEPSCCACVAAEVGQ